MLEAVNRHTIAMSQRRGGGSGVSLLLRGVCTPPTDPRPGDGGVELVLGTRVPAFQEGGPLEGVAIECRPLPPGRPELGQRDTAGVAQRHDVLDTFKTRLLIGPLPSQVHAPANLVGPNRNNNQCSYSNNNKIIIIIIIIINNDNNDNNTCCLLSSEGLCCRRTPPIPSSSRNQRALPRAGPPR